MNKLHIRTFGCQMNEYDSDQMVNVLKHSHNLELTDDANLADVLLLNTWNNLSIYPYNYAAN